MKESVLSVLVYLFRNYFLGEPDTVHDRASLQAELIEAGFDALHVGKAFDWLADLQDEQPSAPDLARQQPLRVYAPEELDLLDTDCRGFLMALEQRGVLDADARERVIERALALEQSPVDLHDLKWVVLLVLYNTPDREAGYAWMESELLAAHLARN
ncbi:MAG: DUF494 domain-containing protein [Xanthomonadales bacterium]|nr:DUF494 domain-containing protein [Xanthomonadales bacterium]MCC6559892.1 DUF494 domain-containing protein [Xanthomonadales bacterium]